ncbi:MAG: hypothetical protein IPO40_10515 [Fibrobacteres bacterium]|nr:hypothetical protein [Fibrobacterota bacterium]
MNEIDLKYWQVVVREKQIVEFRNYENSTEIFNDFKFTGLNNFDFFMTEFYKNGLSEEEK